MRCAETLTLPILKKLLLSIFLYISYIFQDSCWSLEPILGTHVIYNYTLSSCVMLVSPIMGRRSQTGTIYTIKAYTHNRLSAAVSVI